MKKTVFFGITFCCLWVALSTAASAQVLINELAVNPGGTDNPCEYIELIGAPNAVIQNFYFVSIEGDLGANPGTVTAFASFGNATLGTNGLLVVIGTQQCGMRTYDTGTTVVRLAFLDTNNGALQNATNSFLLISSPTPITLGTDYDADNNGSLELLPAGAVVVDSVAFTDGEAGDITYGGAVLTSTAGVIGGATRFPGNTTANSASAFYGGALTGSNSSNIYSSTIRTANFGSGALTPGAPNVAIDSPVDVNADGKTDYVVVRTAANQATFLTKFNGGNPTSPREWGIAGDRLISGDFDGDLRDDVAVFRPSNATFYIIQSSSLTIRIEQLGETGDDPTIVADYNGDGRDDLAVYREAAQSTWFYRTAPDALFVAVNWGQEGDFVAPGDYDGDGRADFVVQRAEGLVGRFLQRFATGTLDSIQFGLASDLIVPGDYDGDGKTDIAVIRTNPAGFIAWDFEPSGTPGLSVVSDVWGDTEFGDVPTQGDYDGDGKTDYSVWRPTTGRFFVMTVGTRNIFGDFWGQSGDLPVAGYNTH